MKLNLNTMSGALKYCKNKGWLENATFEFKNNNNKISIDICDLNLTDNYYVYAYLKSKSLKKMNYQEISEIIYNANQRDIIKNY